MGCLRWRKHEEEVVDHEPKVEYPSLKKTISKWIRSIVEKMKVERKWRENVSWWISTVEGTCDGHDSSSTIASRMEESVLSHSSQYSRHSHLKLYPSEQESLMACESKREGLKGMEELEAELEVELERLQLQLDGEIFSKCSHHHTETMVEDAALDPRKVAAGVPSVELERKLHELWESRQQERIEELEAALRHAEKKLHEKEKEISWWKDAALIISQRAVEPSHGVM